jgi:DNA repair photolyase
MRHADPARRKELNNARRSSVRLALHRLLHFSTLNVRILTRSPLAREDFDIMQRFGPRLLFGMSIPTLNNKLAKIYEPDAPAPTRRLETLIEARRQGINTYVAIAPTYPELEFDDIQQTMRAVTEAAPVTVFAEPINIRAENVERIRKEGVEHGVEMRVDVFKTPETWSLYALKQLRDTEQAAQTTSIADRLHLWPDAALGSRRVRGIQRDATAYDAWLRKYWERVSEWPKLIT